MALATGFSNQRVSVGHCPSKASRVLASSPAPHQHQTRGRDVVRASTPAAVNQLQACELGRGVDPRSLSRIQIGWFSPSRRSVRCPSRCIDQTLRVRAHVAAPLTFHSSTVNGSRRPALNTLAHEQVFQCLSHALHFHHRLSSFAVSVGIDPNENGLTKWTSILCIRSKPR